MAIVPALLGVALQAVAAEIPALQVWPVDPLIKVFPDLRPATPNVAVAEVAPGEHASLQLVVFSERPVASLHAEVAELRQVDQPATRSGSTPACFRRANTRIVSSSNP